MANNKLYPPQIEGTLPAFCEETIVLDKDNKKRTYSITIPYNMNTTVNIKQVAKMAIRIKTIQSNTLVYTGRVDIDPNQTNFVTFNIEEKGSGFQNGYSHFTVGQFYKVQIAYVQIANATTLIEEVGYYSTVGIIKCTTNPTIYIANMVEGTVHSNIGNYTGIYSNLGDQTEKIYSYYFSLYDNYNQLIMTTGDLLHNAENDTSIEESKDEFQLSTYLEENKIYNLVYGVTTINGIKKETNKYKIVQQSTIPPDIKAHISVDMNFNNGYVQIHVIGKNNPDTGLEENAIGTFQILRASELSDYTDWQIIHRFAMFGSPPSLLDIKDFTVEQGKVYKYALQQYNHESGIVSDKMLSNEILVDFEDCFLYDGERQLKIKYNPKISSFKETLLEAKTNTLGGQYPFIFRNGKVSYKEFPISGLISYLMDEEHLFLSDKDMGLENFTNEFKREFTLKTGVSVENLDYFETLGKYHAVQADNIYRLYLQREAIGSNEYEIANKKTRTTQLSDYNQAAERIFKLKVLEFLNDGKPKLFRSAAEGNYIVRLMNSSLSPNDQLGRMLHNFSTTATEVEPFDVKALQQMEIITSEQIDTKQMRWETVLLNSLLNKESDQGWIKLNNYTAISLQCLDMVPGTRVRITFENELNPVEIVIGVTGAYYSNLEKNITKIEVHNEIFNVSTQGQVTYGFYGTTFNHFDTYAEFNINDIPLVQFIGEKRTYDEENKKYRQLGIREQLTDVRNKITNFNLLHFTKREVVPIYKFTTKNKQSNITQTKYYTVPNIHSADIDYNQFTTNLNLNDWNDVEQLSDKNLAEKNLIKVIDKEWLDKTPSQAKTDWYQYNLGTKGITSLRCAIPAEKTLTANVQPLLIYLKTNLDSKGKFIEVNPNNQTVFVFNSNEAQIIDLRFRLPPLINKQTRKGYLSYETYWEFDDDKKFQEVFKDSIEIKNFEPLTIYKIVNSTIGDNEIYLDGNTKEFVEYSNLIRINDANIDITQTEEYEVTIPKEIEEVYISSGIIADVGVQRRTILYGIELNPNPQYNSLKNKKKLWEQANVELKKLLFFSEGKNPEEDEEKYNNLDSETYQNDIDTQRRNVNNYYEQYIMELNKQLNLLVGEVK